ncbi:MAG: carbonic anhydrase [Patescibacteria group bacterium]
MGQMDTQNRIVHGCQLTVLTCMDFRLHGATNLPHYLAQRFGEHATYDLLTPPGACYSLIHDGEVERQRILDHLALSVSLHAPETILIIPHIDCGRYHAARKFLSMEDEIDQLTQDVLMSGKMLLRQFPKAEVRGFIAKVSDRMTIGLEEVHSAPIESRRGTLQFSSAS